MIFIREFIYFFFGLRMKRKDSEDIFNPIIAKKGEPLISGDVVLMERLRKINVHHYTVFDSIVYHFQEGEMRE